MKTTLFAALAAVSVALASPVAFAGSEAYPDAPAQTIVASPSSSAGFAGAYPENGPVAVQLGAATAVNNTGAQHEPEFAGAATSYGASVPAIAQNPAGHING